MVILIALTIFIVITIVVSFPKKKQCTNCGSRNTTEMPFGTGKYCNDCYQRFE